MDRELPIRTVYGSEFQTDGADKITSINANKIEGLVWLMTG